MNKGRRVSILLLGIVLTILGFSLSSCQKYEETPPQSQSPTGLDCNCGVISYVETDSGFNVIPNPNGGPGYIEYYNTTSTAVVNYCTNNLKKFEGDHGNQFDEYCAGYQW